MCVYTTAFRSLLKHFRANNTLRLHLYLCKPVLFRGDWGAGIGAWVPDHPGTASHRTPLSSSSASSPSGWDPVASDSDRPARRRGGGRLRRGEPAALPGGGGPGGGPGGAGSRCRPAAPGRDSPSHRGGGGAGGAAAAAGARGGGMVAAAARVGP